MRRRACWTSSSVTMEARDANAEGCAAARGGGAGYRSCRRRARRDRLALRQPAGELDAVAHAELVEDGLEVALHRLRRDGEPLGDLARAQPLGDEERHLALALG